MNAEAQHRLENYFQRDIGGLLKRPEQRESFALYAMGILGDAARKSIEPIAAQLCPDVGQVSAVHQRLQHFIADSPWSDRDVRRVAARYVLEAMTQRSSEVRWILDDTGFLKQGTHSVGVQRQYTGSAGKIANCQIGVSLSVATNRAHALVDMELYLPESWMEDQQRRRVARIPEELEFRTKPELGLEMVKRAVRDGLPKGIVLADSAFGDNQQFRGELRRMGLDYAVGIHGTTKVMVIGQRGQRSEPISARDLAATLQEQCKPITWREGTSRPLRARFVFRRVTVAADPQQEPVWLVMEWPEGDPAPSKFYLCTLPATTPKARLVRTLKERYRTEQLYSELKGELGLDHYEGRRYTGWHHHISAVLCCYAFVVAERERHFPPSAGRQAAPCPLTFAA